MDGGPEASRRTRRSRREGSAAIEPEFWLNWLRASSLSHLPRSGSNSRVSAAASSGTATPSPGNTNSCGRISPGPNRCRSIGFSALARRGALTRPQPSSHHQIPSRTRSPQSQEHRERSGRGATPCVVRTGASGTREADRPRNAADHARLPLQVRDRAARHPHDPLLSRSRSNVTTTAACWLRPKAAARRKPPLKMLTARLACLLGRRAIGPP